MRNHLVVIFVFNLLSHCFAQVQVQQNVGNTNLAQNQVQQNQGGAGGIQIQQNVNNTNLAQNQVQQNTGNQGQGQGNVGQQAVGVAVVNQGAQGGSSGNQNQPGLGPQNNNNQNQLSQGNQNWNGQNQGNPNWNLGQNQGWNQNNWNNGQQIWNNNSGQIQMQNYQPANRQNLNVGNPDRGNITRPCQAYDMNCIRKFFAKHSYCKPSYGPVPEPYFRKRDIVYLPRVNLTATVYDERLMGLNGRVEDFYINIDTDKLVIVVEFRGLNVASNKTYIRIHRRAREPIIVKTYSNVTYESVVVTTIIPQIYKLRLDQAEVFAFVNDPNPDYQLGPDFTNSIDPTVQRTYREFTANPAANVGEIFLTHGPFFPTTFIQYSICDFGVKVL